MKLHASAPGAANTFTGYGEGYVLVNGERRDSSLVVLPDRIEAWRPDAFDRLSTEDFAFLMELDVDIVLLGTGARQRGGVFVQDDGTAERRHLDASRPAFRH